MSAPDRHGGVSRARLRAVLCVAACLGGCLTGGLTGGLTGCSDCRSGRTQATPTAADDGGEPVSAPAESAADMPDMPDMPEMIVVSRVEIAIAEPRNGPAHELYPRELARSLGSQLSQSRFFVARAEDVPAGHRARIATVDVRVSYDLVDSEERGGRVAVAAIESEIDWDDPRAGDLAPTENVFVEHLLTADERKNQGGVLATLVADSLVQVGHGLIAKEQVRAGGVDGIEQALASHNPDLIVWALDLVAERRHATLLDPVLKALESTDAVVRNRALTALVALGDARAVDALARRAQFDDHEFMHMVIEAVSVLGGDDARDYLEFVASGHPERSVRKRAEDALERLEAAGAAGSGGSGGSPAP